MKRILTMSNIHGYYSQMMKLLEIAKYNPSDDRLVILGGLLDYGPQSFKVIKECMNLQKEGAIILKGEREQLYINAFVYEHFKSEELIAKTKNNKIYHYLNNFDIQNMHISFLKDLPYKYKIDNYFFSHAGFNPNKIDDISYYLANNNFHTKGKLLTAKIKYIFGYHIAYNLGKDYGKFFLRENMIGIDLGAGRLKNGYLGLLELTDDYKKTYKLQV
ncbi:MAG: metallophosphoesterase [Candidatus Woesearchaeota archaeon]